MVLKDGENHLDQEYPMYNNKKANWIGHILHRTYLLNHVVEGKLDGRIEVMER